MSKKILPKKVTQVEPKRGRGRPKGSGKPQKPYIDNNILVSSSVMDIGNIDHINNGDFQSATRLKDKMTLKELKFISLYLSGDYNQEKAIDLAGYEGYHPTYKRQLACKIIAKYELQADDHRKIARAMGAGEVFVIKGLTDLAKNAKSEAVKLQALVAIAKCLGLQREIVEGAGGITIVFEGADQAGQPISTLPPAQAEQAQPISYQVTGKVLQITK